MFNKLSIKNSFKLTKNKTILILFFWLVWNLFFSHDVYLCSQCHHNLKNNCLYDEYKIFNDCNCDCYTLSEVIDDYVYLFFSLIVIYFIVSIVSGFFNTPKIKEI